MSEKHEQSEYFHWQDLAEQLGADTSHEIDDYFSGTATFENVVLDESELPEILPPEPVKDLTNQNQPEQESTVVSEQAESTHDEPVVIDSESDSRENETSEPELEINWESPASGDSASKPSTSRESAEQKRKKESGKKGGRKRKPEPKPEVASETPDPAPEFGHWDDLASTLGLAPAPAETTSPETTSVDKPADPEPEPVSVSVPDKPRSRSRSRSKQKQREPKPAASTPEPAQPKPKRTAQASGFGAGLVGFDEVECSDDELAQKAILEGMFVLSDEPIDDDTEVHEEPAAEVASSSIIVEGDDEFVEFEVEELDPVDRRSSRKKRSSRDRSSRSERSSRPEGRPAKPSPSSDVEDEPEEPEEQAPRKTARRKPRSEDQEDQDQRGSRRVRRKRPAEESVAEEKPRRRRSRRSEKTGTTDEQPRSPRESSEDDRVSSLQPSDVEVFDDVPDELDEDSVDRGKQGKRKPNNLPTWSETIDVIVDGNLSTRKKPARRKRSGGGRPRRNQNRDRD